uniref:Uncharacterized protein n=1 Tax=Romanomermis culicivorax TaxID=13658 RepID=A0A915JTE7_ROMCU
MEVRFSKRCANVISLMDEVDDLLQNINKSWRETIYPLCLSMVACMTVWLLKSNDLTVLLDNCSTKNITIKMHYCRLDGQQLIYLTVSNYQNEGRTDHLTNYSQQLTHRTHTTTLMNNQ